MGIAKRKEKTVGKVRKIRKPNLLTNNSKTFREKKKVDLTIVSKNKIKTHFISIHSMISYMP